VGNLALPKGEGLLVPFFCDVYVDKPIYGEAEPEEITKELQKTFAKLQGEANKRVD